jgi:hypothetical protein
VIHCQQDVVSGRLGSPQQLSIFPAFETGPLSRVRFVTFMRFWRAGSPCFFKRLDRHLTRDAGKLPKELAQRMAALEVVNQQSRHPLRTELRRQFVRLTLLRGEEASRAEPALRDSWQCLKSDHFNVGQPIGELVPKVSGRQPGMIKEKRSSLDLTWRRLAMHATSPDNC